MKEKFEEEDLDVNGFDDLTDLDFGGEREKETTKKSNLWKAMSGQNLKQLGKKISFAKDILALVNYMRDPIVSWHRKAIVVAALVYFISPIDAIPDLTPLFGYLDDLGVITALLKFLGSELIPYYSPGYRA